MSSNTAPERSAKPSPEKLEAGRSDLEARRLAHVRVITASSLRPAAWAAGVAVPFLLVALSARSWVPLLAAAGVLPVVYLLARQAELPKRATATMQIIMIDARLDALEREAEGARRAADTEAV
jgi:hypothetical protein